ncbi:hypothetical protein V2J09_010909 [Rumex salicifolius]
MACQLLRHSPPLLSFNPNRRKFNRSHRFRPPISCQSRQNSEEDNKNRRINGLELLGLSVTFTVVSPSLLPYPALAAPAKVTSEKKRASAAGKKQEVWTPEQVKSWSQGLPLVKDRLPYSDFFELKSTGRLKHLIKPTSAALRRKPTVVLAVLDDSRVFRTVLPSMEGNPSFWGKWDELAIDSLFVNAYTPPIKRPEIPSPYLGFLLWVPQKMLSLAKPKSEPKKTSELQRMKAEMMRQKKEETERIREETAMMERAIKAQKRMEERRIKREQKAKNRRLSFTLATFYDNMGDFWGQVVNNSFVETVCGLLFAVLFYQVVVVNYKKQKKDYDDRIKIEKAEAEERRKMRDLERGLQGLERGGDYDEEQGGQENAYIKKAKDFMKSGARVRLAKHKRLPQYLDRDVDVKFSDVAGLGKIKIELEEIVKFFTEAEIYRRRGVKIPGGILLCGPPGVGKTLLAKAVAGEAGVNFFSISASQFVEIYVGVGASRVRALYQEAKDNAPSVVFIDELDAVGRERGRIKGSGGQERDATLNQLLVCLDGFEGRGDVITIASTNRPDILDPALVRPGRFDRKIFIPKPSLKGRVEILKVHSRKKKMAEDVDYMAVAKITERMVGAELANIVEVAALNTLRDGRDKIMTDDLLQAAQMEERGILDKKERSPEMWRRIALNEAAQAVAAVNFPDFKNIEFITIAPRAGKELGYVRFKIDLVRMKEGLLSRQSVLDHITLQLAPRAADEIWYGEDQLSTIWTEAADDARSAARTLVLSGLSEKHYGLFNFWTEKINDIDLEALDILHMCYERVKQILVRNRKLMDVLVNELAEKKSLTKEEFFGLVEVHGSLEALPPSILDLRAKRREQFRDMITQHNLQAPLTSV